jgi:hypothetical protein
MGIPKTMPWSFAGAEMVMSRCQGAAILAFAREPSSAGGLPSYGVCPFRGCPCFLTAPSAARHHRPSRWPVFSDEL